MHLLDPAPKRQESVEREAPLDAPQQGLESGTLVKIHSLKDKPELNGLCGTYIGPAERDGRFLVQPMGSSRFRPLQ